MADFPTRWLEFPSGVSAAVKLHPTAYNYIINGFPDTIYPIFRHKKSSPNITLPKRW